MDEALVLAGRVGVAPSVVTADSVAMRVWPMAWVPCMAARSKRSVTVLGPADFLVDLHAAAASDELDVGRRLRQPRDQLGHGVVGQRHHGMGVVRVTVAPSKEWVMRAEVSFIAAADAARSVSLVSPLLPAP